MTDKLDQFFSDLDPLEWVRLLVAADLWTEVEFDDGVTIFEEGATSQELYLILEGEVEIAKEVGEGKGRKVLALLPTGSMFGEGALLSDKPRSASAVARSKVKVLQLKKDDFDAFVREKPEDAAALLLSLLKVVNRRLQWTSHELVTLYDVARIVSESREDLQELVRLVGEKVAAVSGASSGRIVLKSGLKTEWGDFSGESETLEVKDLGGNVLGTVFLVGELKGEACKVVGAIADQLGIALADRAFMEAEKGRGKLARRNVSF